MEPRRIEEPGFPALLEFSGPDALRFLNGQVTQDVRLVREDVCLPACVTDAKGRLQFRVWLCAGNAGGFFVSGPPETAEDLENRLTRYLIADDVEVADLTGRYRLVHFTGVVTSAPDGVIARRANRYGIDGTDWWIPVDQEVPMPDGIPQSPTGIPQSPDGIPQWTAEELEDFRIRQGIPLWGRELQPGMLPPEAGLDATDISYHKGCYIGQEVISRIKFAGKLNRRLVKAQGPADVPLEEVSWLDPEGRLLAEVTSVSPLVTAGKRHALGYQTRVKI